MPPGSETSRPRSWGSSRRPKTPCTQKEALSLLPNWGPFWGARSYLRFYKPASSSRHNLSWSLRFFFSAGLGSDFFLHSQNAITRIPSSACAGIWTVYDTKSRICRYDFICTVGFSFVAHVVLDLSLVSHQHATFS